MPHQRKYSDSDLSAAVVASRSWREVLRRLGMAGTSAGSMRSVRRHAERLGVEHSHFTGQRRWSDDELRAVVADAESWTDVISGLGLRSGSSLATVKGHAARLDLDVSHLSGPPESMVTVDLRPDLLCLDRAGSMLAASWFTLCGYDVAWPLEPCRHDLVVTGSWGTHRVQVKTTTTYVGASWKVYLSTTRGERRPYVPEEVDAFFVIDGDLDYYLIPLGVVGGLHAIHLNRYKRYRLEQARRGPAQFRGHLPD